MEQFFTKAYVCYLRASQMNGVIEQSINDEQAFNTLKRIATTYQKKQTELVSRQFGTDDELLLHSTLFSNEMFISYTHSKEKDASMTEDMLSLILDDIQELLAYFRHEGITLEGGLSYDDVYHSGNMIIGPAVVKAVFAKPKTELGIWLDKEIFEFLKDNGAFAKYISGARLIEKYEEIVQHEVCSSEGMGIFGKLRVLRNLKIGSFGVGDAEKSTYRSINNDIRKQETSIKDFNYKTGLIFYMDILGCRALSLTSGADETSLTKVKKIVEIFWEIEKQYEDKHWGKYYKMPFTHEGYTVDRPLGESNIEVTMSLFSDSIIISYYPETTDRFVVWYEQMHQIFNDICRTIFLFARNGFFLRGGMSYGIFFHSGNICFGPALLEAFRLEAEICYPTIAICDTFRNKIRDDLGSKEIDDYAPGYKYPYELKAFAKDFFSIFLDSTIVNGQTKLMLDWLLSIFYYSLDGIEPIKKAIIEELNADYPDKVKEKYIWLAKRFNHSLYGLLSLGLGDYLHSKIQIKE